MIRIALIGTISVVLLLAAGTIASAKGIGPVNRGYGHTFNVTGHVGRMFTGDTTTTGGTTTMPGSSQTMAGYIAYAAEQMRARAAQMAAVTDMQPATGMDPGYGMQSDNMDPGNMDTGTGYMDPGNMGSTASTGTMGSSTGSGAQMGITGTGTTHTSGGGSMMGR